MLATYKQLLAFYNSSDALRKGGLTPYADADVIAFAKQYQNEHALILVNTRNRTVTYNMPSALISSTWTNISNNTTMTLGNTLTLFPYQYYLLKQ